MSTAANQNAREMVRQSGARVTGARVAVLAALLGARRPLSHQEVLDRLRRAQAPFDRVTLYRVLDWLAEHGLAHKLAGDDRVYRYAAGQGENGAGGLAVHAAHGHFQCMHCHKVYCLDDMPRLPHALSKTLPEGFVGRQLELTVRGYCAACRR